MKLIASSDSYEGFNLTAGRGSSYDGPTDRLQSESAKSELGMGSFGERLRREREMRGITLDEISGSTKIARRHLESLEADNFDALPGGIFNRGFVRAYARFLGLDEDQAVADYVAVNAEPAPAEESFPVEIEAEPDPKLNPRRSSLPLLLALLALVAVLAVFWARKGRQTEATENAQPPKNAAPATSGTPVSTDRPASVSAAATSPNANPKPASHAAQPANPSAGAPVAQAATGLSGDHFSIAVQAKGDAWIMVKADGKTVSPGRIMKAGDQESVQAGKQIVLITGNAGGIDISFNGKPLGPIGKEGAVRTLTFTAGGLVQ